VGIATAKNIPPVAGVSVVVCSTGDEMWAAFGKQSAAKKSLTKSSVILDAALLLALMFQGSILQNSIVAKN
jgi:hypothetical protein